MAIDPFRTHLPLDESSFLKVNVKNLKNENLPEDFNVAINTLVQIRNVLVIAKKLGRLHEIGQWPHYLDALRWLKFEMPLSNLISVPQISHRKTMDGTTAQNFRQYCDILLTQLKSQPVYMSIEISMAALRSNITERRRETIEDTLDEMNEAITNEVTLTANERISHINREASDGRNRLRAELLSAMSQFQAAQSLEKWDGSYAKQIEEYKLRLFGMTWAKNTITRNYRSIGILKEKCSNPLNGKRANAVTLVRVILPHVIRNANSMIRFWHLKYKSYNGKRAIWFAAIAIFVIFFTSMSFISLLEVRKIFGIDVTRFSLAHDKQWYTKLTIYLPIGLILGLAYSFAVKNYRIYSNMLDQYEHRKTVASTSQGIIRSLTSERDTEIRNTITAAAATALFEHKNTGHLTKAESESLSPLDLFKLVK